MGFGLMSSTTEEAGLVGFLGHGQPEIFFHLPDAKSIEIAAETSNQHQPPPAAPLVCSTIHSSALSVGMMGYAAPSSVGLPKQVSTSQAADLSDILEHALDQEQQLDNMPCGSQLPHEHSIAADANSLSSYSLNMQPQAKSNLIRHSSSPADFLSRLVIDKMNGQAPLQFNESNLQPTYPWKPLGEASSSSVPKALPQLVSMPCFSIRDCLVDLTTNHKLTDKGYNMANSDVNSSGLLRQSSSPAGLLSQLSIEEISNAGYIHDIAAGSFGQRKRARELDAEMLQVSLAKEALGQQQRSPPADIMIPTSCSSPKSHIENMEISSMIDSVLCKARAKRGCATHPRSIAERVRRTKISERMKRLQDLVPNLDKQASTAEMLDEVVEYVKLLQRQVQELSEKQPKCNGVCQQKLNC